MEIKTVIDAQIVLRAAHRVLVKKSHQPIDQPVVDVTIGDHLITRFTDKFYPTSINEVSARLLLKLLDVDQGGESNE